MTEQREDVEIPETVEDPVESVDVETEETEAEEVENDAAEDSNEELSRLEEEGDRAADYIEELLDIADLDGDIDIEVRGGRSYVSVVAGEDDEGLSDLVGRNGKVLEALQELTRLAVLSSTGQRSRLVLDIADHRKNRAVELREVAEEAIEQLKDGEDEVHLKPMSAYERKIVHDVAAEAGYVSESEGEGSRRHVVLSHGE